MNIDIKNLELRLEMFSDSNISFVDKYGVSNRHKFSDLLDKIYDKKSILEKSNIKDRQRVGIMAENSLDWMAWDIALLASNNIPVVFSDQHKNMDLNTLREQYHCSLMVTDRIHSSSGQIVSITEKNSSACHAENFECTDSPDVLTLTFSSGTTGHLKGLYISTRGTNHILNQFCDAFDLTPDDKYYSFLDFSYFQQRALYYTSLSLGIDTAVGTVDRFIQDFSAEKPTYTINPPVFYEAIYRYYIALKRSGKDISLRSLLGGNIRWMITAMAPIEREIIDFYWENDIRLFETYGVTETGMVAWNTLRDYKVGTVGKPAGDGELVVAQDGEIFCKREHQLSLGYFDVEPLTASEIFRQDGLIATGDVGRVDDDGFVTLLGRKKSVIVTSGGKKFHPEEVEEAARNKIRGCIPVFIGGAGICENTLVFFQENDSTRRDTDAISKIVAQLNDKFQIHMKVHRIFISDAELKPENGLRTRNYKLNRPSIQERLLAEQLSGYFLNT